MTKEELETLQFAKRLLNQCMEFFIENHGYSNLTLHLEGTYHELTDIIEKYKPS